MSDPRRLREGGGSEDGLALLRSAEGDLPPPQAKKLLLDSLGLSDVGVTSAGATEASALRSRSVKPLERLGKATMFDSVLNRGNVPNSRFGRGAFFSAAVHVVLLGAAVYIGSRPADPRKKDVSVTFVAEAPPPPPAAEAPPPPPPPPPPARRSKPKTEKIEVKDDPEPVKKPDTIVEAKEEAAEKQVDVAETTPKGGDGDDNGGVEGGVEGGVKGGVVGGVLGGKLGSTTPVPTNVVIPFGAGMNRPSIVSGADPIYTKEALAARVEGLMIVRCTITVTGSITNCRAIKSLPHMEQQVISALQARKYTPVQFQGRAVAVDYVFNIKLVLPSR